MWTRDLDGDVLETVATYNCATTGVTYNGRNEGRGSSGAYWRRYDI